MPRLLTFILTIVLLAETVSPGVVYAQEVPAEDVTSEGEEIVNEQQPVPEEEAETEDVITEETEQEVFEPVTEMTDTAEEPVAAGMQKKRSVQLTGISRLIIMKNDFEGMMRFG